MMARRNPPCDIEIPVGYPIAGKIFDHYEVEADCVSDQFAVNRDVVSREQAVEYAKTWTITHIPTGYAVITELPSKKVALAAGLRMTELGYGSVSRDPRVATAEMADQGLPEFKAWLLRQTQAKGRKPTAARLEAAIRAWPEEVAAKPPTRKRAPKKRTKRAVEDVDLLSMAAEIRGENPGGRTDVAHAKAQCLW